MMKKHITCLATLLFLLPLSAKDEVGTNSLRDKIDKFNNASPGVINAGDTNSTPAAPATPTGPSRETGPAAANEIARLVENACQDGAFIICQPFDAVDNQGEHYGGPNGEEEAGKTYSIGFFIDGGYLFTPEALEPWKFDSSNFNRITELAQADGLSISGSLLGKTTMADQSKKPSYESISFDATNYGNVYPGRLYSMAESSDNFADGFFPFREEGELHGYIVWYLLGSPTQDLAKDTRLQARAIPHTINLTDKLEEVYPLDCRFDNPLGAIYVVPYSPGIGRYYFYLYGVASKQPDGKWGLVFPFEDPNKVFDKQQGIAPQAIEAPKEKPKHESTLSQFRKRTQKPAPEEQPDEPAFPAQEESKAPEN